MLRFHADNGRPGLPPSLLSGVLLWQFHDALTAAEAVERCKYDVRWKVALDLPLDFPGFDPSSSSYFRTRLVEPQQERYAFGRLIKVGRTAGFIPDKVTLLTDTTWAKGASAVQDTHMLVRRGIRKLMKQLGHAVPGKRHGLADTAQRLIATYLDADRKYEAYRKRPGCGNRSRSSRRSIRGAVGWSASKPYRSGMAYGAVTLKRNRAKTRPPPLIARSRPE